MRAYLAGPEVFLPNAVEIGAAKKATCAKYGIEGVYPLDSGADVTGSDKALIAFRISQANEALIRGCELVIANMTPFRGPSADVGTAYEMGFARGCGLRVFAYTNTMWKYTERMRWSLGPNPRENAAGDLLDEEGMFVEGFGLWDNLMLDGAVLGSGSEVVWHPSQDRGRFHKLDGFEACVAKAAKMLGLKP